MMKSTIHWLGDVNLQLQIFFLLDGNFGDQMKSLSDAVIVGFALFAIRVEIVDFRNTGLAYHSVLIVPLVDDLRVWQCGEKIRKKRVELVFHPLRIGSIFSMAFCCHTTVVALTCTVVHSKIFLSSNLLDLNVVPSGNSRLRSAWFSEQHNRHIFTAEWPGRAAFSPYTWFAVSILLS